MVRRILHVLVRVALLTAIAAAAALYVDYSREAPAFCGEVSSGCAAVRASALSHPFGVGLPTLGLAALLACFAAAVALHHIAVARVVLAGALAMGALVGLGLIAMQLFTLKAVCVWCMTVDVSVVIAAGSAIALARSKEPTPVEPWFVRLGWVAVAGAAVAVPISWAGDAPQRVELPAQIRAFQTDKIDIVMFTDFECPYCRRMHAAVEAEIERAPGRFHLVRVMVPLVKIHPGAGPAARTYLCTPEAKREAMAGALYTIEPETMSKERMAELAKKQGLDAQEFAACYDGKDTTATIEADTALYKTLEIPGLPTLYVEDVMIVGANLKSFERAVGGLHVGLMFAILATAFAAVACASMAWSRNQ
jgi:protein-disulfide isomerase/uncharacterized membrane protein